MKPEALLFDLDGVLADVSRSFRVAVQATAATYSVELSSREIRARKAAGGANNDWVLTQDLLAAHGIQVPLDEVTARFEEIYQGTKDRPGLRTTETPLVRPEKFAEWASRFPVGIVTGREPDCAWRFLRDHDLDGSVKALVGMGEAPGKPDPKPVYLALARLDVSSAWMVGDNPDDMRAASGAGVRALGIIAPGDLREEMEPALRGAGAELILRELDELDELLASA